MCMVLVSLMLCSSVAAVLGLCAFGARIFTAGEGGANSLGGRRMFLQFNSSDSLHVITTGMIICPDGWDDRVGAVDECGKL